MIRQLMKQGVITIDYMETKRYLADPFTKSISKASVFIKSREMRLRFVNKG